MKNIKGNKGFTFIELGIVLTVIGLALMVLVPKAQNYFLNGKIQTLTDTMDEIRKGMVDCRSRFNTYTNCTWTMLTDEGFISAKTAAGATNGNPWGGSYGVAPGAQTFDVTAGSINAKACTRMATTFNQMSGAAGGGVANGVSGACAGGTITITYTN